MHPTTPAADRLNALLRNAAAGRFPAADMAVEVIGSPGGRSDAIVAFSGHNVVAANVDPESVRAQLPDDDPAGPMGATFLAWLGERLGTVAGSLDVVLVADEVAEDALTLGPATGAIAHARVERALAYRSDVRVFTDLQHRGLVILGRGLAGRLEVSIELDPVHRGRGFGIELARAARALVTGGEPLFAQVAPGNVASLRAFLGAGYRPVCSEVLFLQPGGAA